MLLAASSAMTTGNASPDCRLSTFHIGTLASPMSHVTCSSRCSGVPGDAADAATAAAGETGDDCGSDASGDDGGGGGSASDDDRNAPFAAAVDGPMMSHATPHAALARSAQTRQCVCARTGASTTMTSATPRVGVARCRPVFDTHARSKNDARHMRARKKPLIRSFTIVRGNIHAHDQKVHSVPTTRTHTRARTEGSSSWSDTYTRMNRRRFTVVRRPRGELVAQRRAVIHKELERSDRRHGTRPGARLRAQVRHARSCAHVRSRLERIDEIASASAPSPSPR